MVAPAPNPAIAAPVADPAADTSRKLTRSQVAEALDVSISTVRRLEGTRLHPEIGPGNTRLFDPAEVAAVAASLARSAPPPPEPKAPALTRGELAARIFERFEQRYSLSEIVIELRVAPDLVRELYHQWRVGLAQGESRRTDAMPSASELRAVSEVELQALLAGTPYGKTVRLSVARVVGERSVDGVRVYDVVELGGFTVAGPTSQGAIVDRYGWDRFRVAASDDQTRALLWEVVTPFL